MRKFMSVMLGLGMFVMASAVISTGVASAQAQGEPREKAAIEMKVEMAHQKGLGDKAYVQALEKNDRRVLKETLVRNGAPASINIVDPRVDQGGPALKKKGWTVTVKVTLGKPVTIDVSFSKG